MIGLSLIAAGWVLVVVACFFLFGVAVLIPAGVLTMAVGAFVDLDSVKEPPRA